MLVIRIFLLTLSVMYNKAVNISCAFFQFRHILEKFQKKFEFIN